MLKKKKIDDSFIVKYHTKQQVINRVVIPHIDSIQFGGKVVRFSVFILKLNIVTL